MGCTAILLHQLVENYPVIAGFNRDVPYWEAEEKEPHVLRLENRLVYAPSYIENGQELLWIGVNNEGVLAFLTERKDKQAESLAKGSPSRGELVRELLPYSSTAQEGVKYLERVLEEKNQITLFNMVIADRKQAQRVIYFGRDKPMPLDIKNITNELSMKHLTGVYVLPSYSDEEDSSKEFCQWGEMRIQEVREHIGRVSTPNNIRDSIYLIKTLLSDHYEGEGGNTSKASICRHQRDDGAVHTASSTVIAIPKNGLEEVILLYHKGNPCKGKWVDYSAIFR